MPTLIIIVTAIAVFYFLQLLWRIYSDMTDTIAAVYRVNNGMTPRQVYDDARVARWNRRIFVVMFLTGLMVILIFFYPKQAATVWGAAQAFFQFVSERAMMIVDNLRN